MSNEALRPTILNNNNANSVDAPVPVLQAAESNEEHNVVCIRKEHQIDMLPDIDINGDGVGVSPHITNGSPDEYYAPQMENRRPNLIRRRNDRVLEYQSDYPIRRFGRKWRRQEVQGICCLALQIVSKPSNK